MKRRFKGKHQNSPREDTGGDMGDEGGEASAGLTSTRQTSSTDELSVLGETESDESSVETTKALTVKILSLTRKTAHFSADKAGMSGAGLCFSPLTMPNPPICAENKILPPLQYLPERRNKISFKDLTRLSSKFEEKFELTTDTSVDASSEVLHKEEKFELTTDTSVDASSEVLHEEKFEFTSHISADGDDETFRLQCSVPGLFQCTVTGLLFDMVAGGDVLYRTVPWNRSLLGQHHKKPAGPLFDITCVQQCVRQLHLPHCEIRSSAGCDLLSVGHVSDGNIEFIKPHTITETHVVINVSGFSAYGIVKDEHSPPDPVRALVLLFYRPPADPHPESFLSVLLQPANVVLRDVQRTRRRSVGEELYISVSPQCKLQPNQVYRLFTNPQDDSIKIQPKKAEFHNQFCCNCFNSFEVILKTTLRSIRLCLKRRKGFVWRRCVWRRCVYLPSAGGTNSCEKPVQTLTSKKKLLKVRSRFVDAVSAPVLSILMDKLLEIQVITHAEQEEIETQQSRGDKARSLIDTVRRKGKAASSEMMQCFYEVDPFLCEYLGLV